MSGPSKGFGARRKSGDDEARRLAENHPGLKVRQVAALLLGDIVGKGHSIDERFSLAAVPNRLAGFEPRDVALTRSIVTASLRRLGSIRHVLAALMEGGAPRGAVGLDWILVVAAAQICFLDVPDHAAVDLAVRSVQLDKRAAPFAPLVNAVLRNLVRRREDLLAACDPLRHDTPSWLAERWRKTYGLAAAQAIAAAHRDEPTLDLTVRADPQDWAARLDAVILPTGSLRLRGHGAISELDGYPAGAWWVQDAAAAIPARLLGPGANGTAADLCAAPGGKAAQLAAAGWQVMAIDRSAERLKRLSANFERLHLSAEVVVADAMTVKAGPFDAVLVDAPCTATGTIRRHPDIAWTKKLGDIAALALLQTRMLDAAFKLVRAGGTVVYCTCSLEPEEGEAQIAALLRRNPDAARMPIRADEIGGLSELLTPAGDLRTLPFHLSAETSRLAGLDGFFAARLTRRN